MKDYTTSFESLISLCEYNLNYHGDRPLYRFIDRNCKTTETYTIKEAIGESWAIASHLRDYLPSKSNIILFFPHSPKFIVSFYGCILSGNIPVPVTKPRGGSLDYVLKIAKNCDACAILTTSSIKPLFISEKSNDCNFTTLSIDEFDSAPIKNFQPPKARLGDTAFIQYTSGSVLSPKGVVIQHAQILDNSQRIKDNFSITHKDKSFSWLPFHHDMGLIGHIIQPMYSQIENIFLSPSAFLIDPLNWLRGISQYCATFSGGPNFAFELINKTLEHTSEHTSENIDLTRWRLAYCGSEQIYLETAKKFTKQVSKLGLKSNAFFPCYGLAEATLFVCGEHGYNVHTSIDNNSYLSVGKLTEESGVFIDNGVNQTYEEGEIGEILIANNSVSPGYYKEAHNTNNRFTRNSSGVNIVRTGDAGFIKENRLYFVGRINNRIKIRGRSYYLEEFESIAYSLLSKSNVRRVVAFSIETQQSIDIVLLLGFDHTFCREQTSKELNKLRVDFQKEVDVRLATILAVDIRKIPLTTSGKPQRTKCRERYLNGFFETLTE